MKLKLLMLAIIFCVAGLANAEMGMPKAPHGDANLQTGMIKGKLLEGKKGLAGNTVTLEILQGHDLILTIPKKTDPKGGYQFKNIFMSPDFSYSVSTEYNGKMYRTEFVSLGKNEKEKELDLMVGAGAVEAKPLPMPISEDMQKEPVKVKKGFNEYQLLAIILSVCVLGFVFWNRKKKGCK